ncbi:hypothetical protein VTK73DRAFT_351 [Phialemonium thermophilum]|uniref:MBG domain-containing protein n=1 Tax=Phialemonium thermophilum TaxID=223376 RepID=A0ABR3VVJ1_9PEZI
MICGDADSLALTTMWQPPVPRHPRQRDSRPEQRRPADPLQGLNWQNGVIVANQPPGEFVTALQTDQGAQFLADLPAGPVVLSAPSPGATFDLRSAYLGIFLATANSAVVPALDGTITVTGTKRDGSRVSETVAYAAAGPGVVKLDGVVVTGSARLAKATFTRLTDVTAVEIAAETATALDAVVELLESLNLAVTGAVISVSMDSLDYTVED